MPILRMLEIHEMSSEEKQEKLQELRTELTRIKTTVKAGGAVENPGRAKLLRKTIARIMTVINQEEQ